MTFEGVHKSIETVESENFYVIQLQLLPLAGQFLRLKFDFKFLQSCTQTKELYVQIPGLRHAYFEDFSIDNAIYASMARIWKSTCLINLIWVFHVQLSGMDIFF